MIALIIPLLLILIIPLLVILIICLPAICYKSGPADKLEEP